MQPFIVLRVLFSALLHATWNAFLHTSGDRVWQFGMMSFPYLVCSAIVLLFVPAPARESWSYIGASAALQLGYCVALAKGYKGGDFGQIYPIARGARDRRVYLGLYDRGWHRRTPRRQRLRVYRVGVHTLQRAAGRGRLLPIRQPAPPVPRRPATLVARFGRRRNRDGRVHHRDHRVSLFAHCDGVGVARTQFDLRR